jgi:hypothetical protein
VCNQLERHLSSVPFHIDVGAISHSESVQLEVIHCLKWHLTWYSPGAGISQLVLRLAMGCTTEEVRVQVLVGLRIFSSFRPALGFTQSPVEWVPGVKWTGCEAGHLHLMLMSRKCGSIHPPRTPSWCHA